MAESGDDAPHTRQGADVLASPLDTFLTLGVIGIHSTPPPISDWVAGWEWALGPGFVQSD
eukprot:g46305.t1